MSAERVQDSGLHRRNCIKLSVERGSLGAYKSVSHRDNSLRSGRKPPPGPYCTASFAVFGSELGAT